MAEMSVLREFLPSTLEHRPLKSVEKVMLKVHFELDGSEYLDELAHWEKADSPALKTLEAWTWGMRYWGRETLFHLSLYAFQCCKSLWGKQEEGADADVGQVMVGPGGTHSDLLDLCLQWAKLPGEEIAQAVFDNRGEDPELWMNASLGPDHRMGVHACTLIAAHRMASTILEPRDQAARMAAQSLVCAAKAFMATGKDESEAIQAARDFVILEMRRWFGHKW